MSELNRISSDFSKFIDSLTKDVEIKDVSRKNSKNFQSSKASSDMKTSENIDTKKLASVIEEKLNKLKEIFKGEVKFEVDNKIDMVIVKIVDKDSKKVIRQIPSKTAVKMAEMLDKLEGIFLDERA
jgi:flagellar protein FlaG